MLSEVMMELPESIQAYPTDEFVPAPDAAMLEACEKADSASGACPLRC